MWLVQAYVQKQELNQNKIRPFRADILPLHIFYFKNNVSKEVVKSCLEPDQFPCDLYKTMQNAISTKRQYKASLKFNLTTVNDFWCPSNHFKPLTDKRTTKICRHEKKQAEGVKNDTKVVRLMALYSTLIINMLTIIDIDYNTERFTSLQRKTSNTLDKIITSTYSPLLENDV